MLKYYLLYFRICYLTFFPTIRVGGAVNVLVVLYAYSIVLYTYFLPQKKIIYIYSKKKSPTMSHV